MAFNQNAYNNALQQWETSWTAPGGYLEQGISPQQVVDDFIGYWGSQGGNTNQLQTDTTGVLQRVGVYGDSGSQQNLLDGGGGETTGTSYDQGFVDYLLSKENQLRDQLPTYDTAKDTQYQTIDSDIDRQVGSANTQQSRFLQDLGISRNTNIRDRESAFGRVNENSRNLSNSVRNVLGQASGSGSSVFKYLAPHLLAKLASGQNRDVREQFGANERSLDMSQTRGEEDFASLLADLELSRERQKAKAAADMYSGKTSVYNEMADLAGKRVAEMGGSYADILAAQQPYLDVVASLNEKTLALPERYNEAVNINPVDATVPELSKYTVDRQGINTTQQAGTTGSPYAYFLKKRFGQ